jgi:hypothetical protein
VAINVTDEAVKPEPELNNLENTYAANTIPDIAMAARQSFADILQGLQGGDIASIVAIAAKAAAEEQRNMPNAEEIEANMTAGGAAVGHYNNMQRAAGPAAVVSKHASPPSSLLCVIDGPVPVPSLGSPAPPTSRSCCCDQSVYFRS